MRIGRDEPEDLLVAVELALCGRLFRSGSTQKFEFRHIDGVNAREDRAELPRHRRARTGVLVVAQQPAAERLALDPLHDEKPRPERVGLVAEPVRARHRHPRGMGGLQQPELVAPARLHRGRTGVATQDERQALRRAGPLEDRVERPGLAGGTAENSPELPDLHGRRVQLHGQVPGQCGGELGRILHARRG